MGPFLVVQLKVFQRMWEKYKNCKIYSHPPPLKQVTSGNTANKKSSLQKRNHSTVHPQYSKYPYSQKSSSLNMLTSNDHIEVSHITSQYYMSTFPSVTTHTHKLDTEGDIKIFQSQYTTTDISSTYKILLLP
jgi:predicted NodU family carbamoyl transferase